MKQNENDHEDKLGRALLELPREIEPPRDLWAGRAGIAARIEAKRRRRVALGGAGVGATLLLAAAAVALLVRPLSWETAGETPRAALTRPTITRDAPVVPAPTARALPPGDVTAPLLAPEEQSYLAAVSALELTFDARKTELPAKELAAVSASLHAIDAALAMTRASLVDHPDDADLRAELDAEYEQKIDAMNDVLAWTTRS